MRRCVDRHAVGLLHGAQAGGYPCLAGGDGLAVASAVEAFRQGLAEPLDFADVSLALVSLSSNGKDGGIGGYSWWFPMPLDRCYGRADLGGSVSAARIFTVAGAGLPVNVSHFAPADTTAVWLTQSWRQWRPGSYSRRRGTLSRPFGLRGTR